MNLCRPLLLPLQGAGKCLANIGRMTYTAGSNKGITSSFRAITAASSLSLNVLNVSANFRNYSVTAASATKFSERKARIESPKILALERLFYEKVNSRIPRTAPEGSDLISAKDEVLRTKIEGLQLFSGMLQEAHAVAVQSAQESARAAASRANTYSKLTSSASPSGSAATVAAAAVHAKDVLFPEDFRPPLRMFETFFRTIQEINLETMQIRRAIEDSNNPSSSHSNRGASSAANSAYPGALSAEKGFELANWGLLACRQARHRSPEYFFRVALQQAAAIETNPAAKAEVVWAAMLAAQVEPSAKDTFAMLRALNNDRSVNIRERTHRSWRLLNDQLQRPVDSVLQSEFEERVNYVLKGASISRDWALWRQVQAVVSRVGLQVSPAVLTEALVAVCESNETTLVMEILVSLSRDSQTEGKDGKPASAIPSRALQAVADWGLRSGNFKIAKQAVDLLEASMGRQVLKKPYYSNLKKLNAASSSPSSSSEKVEKAEKTEEKDTSKLPTYVPLPPPYLYVNLVEGYVSKGEWKDAVAVLASLEARLVLRARLAGQPATTALASGGPLSPYGGLSRLSHQLAEHKESSLYLYNEMMSKFQAGEQPLLASLLGVVLRSAALNGREEDVSLVVDEMARLGCTSVSDTYTAVLEGSLKAKKKNRVEPLIAVMNMEGCAPTTATIDILLRAAIEANDAEAILSACRIQEEHKAIASYQVLEDAYAAARDLGHPLACNRLYEAKEAHRAAHAQLVAEFAQPLPVVHKPRDRLDEGGRESSGEGGWENRRRYGGFRRDAEGQEKRDGGEERADGKERREGALEAGSEGREQRRGWERREGKEAGAGSSSNDSTGYRRSNNNNYDNNNNNKKFNGGYRTSSYNGRAIERFGAGGYATPAAAEGSSVGVRKERRERGE